MTGIRVEMQEFNDLDVMAQALRSPSVGFLPFQGGVFKSRLRRITVAGLEIRHIQAGAHLMFGEIGANKYALHILHHTAIPATLNGASCTSDLLGILPPGSPTDAIFPAEHDRIGIVAQGAEAASLFESVDKGLPAQGSGTQLKVPRTRLDALAHTILGFADFAQREPQAASRSSVEQAFTEEVRCRIRSVLRGYGLHSSPPRASRAATIAVRKVEEFLRANTKRPIHLDEVSQSLEIPERTLQKYFSSLYGISPALYLKRRRLMLVRHEMINARGSGTLVKSIALNYGFWHLGRFSAEYEQYFGEKPSETLRSYSVN